MNKNESTDEREARFARIWSASRADAKKTQEFMAKGLGVSKKTIQNWESGVTAPDLYMGSEWFRILGLNPLPYYLSFLFPDMFENYVPEDDDDLVEQALIARIKNSTAVEKRELLYMMTGRHGSSWYSLLQMFTAHCHISMKSRVNIARNIIDTYEMEAETGDLVCKGDVQPDMSMLKVAVEEGKRSVIKGSFGYTNVNSDISSEGEKQ